MLSALAKALRTIYETKTKISKLSVTTLMAEISLFTHRL